MISARRSGGELIYGLDEVCLVLTDLTTAAIADCEIIVKICYSDIISLSIQSRKILTQNT
ncbi:hypothetical protein SPLC1_S541310 [Arthrospira platensis C1]|nr:hypothetical protein SPLC1_S541310 [Arthrospira platensis C1]